MEEHSRNKHWENIYQTKTPQEVSWFEETPNTSLSFFEQFHVPLDAKIIDVGGGDSQLVDHLLAKGYTDISVLDISANALERAKKRLGNKSTSVKWIVADAATFLPNQRYDFWHDRAAFHFLTEENDIHKYLQTVSAHLTLNGVFVVGTFSEQGPTKCSGLPIKQYSEKTMAEALGKYFKKVQCIQVDHHTPFNTVQNFIFCSFKKKQESPEL